MTAVYSSRWYRVATLKPRWTTQLKVRRQRQRGETWYLLFGAGNARSVRLNAAAYAFAGRLDGRHSIQELWDYLLNSAHDAPTQSEVIELLAQLSEASLIQFDQMADAERLLSHQERVAKPKRRNSLLAWRIPLFDPSPLLNRLTRLQSVLFSPTAALLWLAVMLLFLLSAIEQAPTLVAHAQQWLTTPRYAALAMLLYPPIKLLHELAHGLAIQRWGGTVPNAGITLMFGLPVPWVDASAATAFSQRRQRVIVGAAGMMAELALAALAFLLWCYRPDGLVRDAAFVTVFIAGVSTLFFNANPLQRLDGYYILTDLLDLPNLAARSRQWWQDLLRRRLLRVSQGPIASGDEPMALAPGERPWLAAYAPLAWLYSGFIAVMAMLWLGSFSRYLGVLGGGLLGWQMLVRPVVTLLANLRRSALAKQNTARRWHRLLWIAGALIAILLLLPLPQRTQVQGVVWPPDQAQLRCDEAGFVSEVLVRDGAVVSPGEIIMRLDNPALRAQIERQSARIGSLETEAVNALAGGLGAGQEGFDDQGRSANAEAELSRARSELDQLVARAAGLDIRAQIAGRVALPVVTDLAMRYLQRGTLVGQVIDDTPSTIRVVLPESEASDLGNRVNRVSVRLASSLEQARAASLVRDGAAAVSQLPSAALSQRHGGPVPTDPQDKNDLKPLRPVVLLDVRLQHGFLGARLGERAWVRFDAGFSPLILQFGRYVRRELLHRLSPQP